MKLLNQPWIAVEYIIIFDVVVEHSVVKCLSLLVKSFCPFVLFYHLDVGRRFGFDIGRVRGNHRYCKTAPCWEVCSFLLAPEGQEEMGAGIHGHGYFLFKK